MSRLPREALYKMLDAIATTPLREGDASLHERSRTSNYERVAALVQACERLAPGVAQRWSQRLFSGEALPLPGGRGTLYAFGSGATIFRLSGASGQVLKVYRRTLGLSRQKLLNYANYLRGKYNTVRGWYGVGPHAAYILPSSYLILHAPLLNAPAVGSVQPFVSQEMHDLFLEFSDDALLAMMGHDPDFASQLRFFGNKTLQVAAQEGRCLDFVGRDNVSVLQKGPGAWQLAILDFGIFDLGQKRIQAPAAHEQIRQRLARLETLLHAGNASIRGSNAGASAIERTSGTVTVSRVAGQR